MKYRGVEQLVACRAHNPEVAGSSPAAATIEKPSDCKALRPRSLGFLFAWSGQKRDFSGTVSLICCAVGIKRTAQASTPRPLYTIGLLVLSGAGQNNHDWQRQNKEDNHKACLLASMVSLRLFPVKKFVQCVACFFVALGKHMAVYVQCGAYLCVAQPLRYCENVHALGNQ